MAVPTLNTYSVNHTAIAVRELYIGDETEINGTVGKFGWGVTPIAASSRATFTQTYSTASLTVANITTQSPSATLVLSATNIASKTASLTLGQSSGSAPTENEFNQLAKDVGTAYNTLRVEVAAAVADILAMKKNDTAIIDALQALGIVL